MPVNLLNKESREEKKDSVKHRERMRVSWKKQG